jgi:hypothetical protein
MGLERNPSKIGKGEEGTRETYLRSVDEGEKVVKFLERKKPWSKNVVDFTLAGQSVEWWLAGVERAAPGGEELYQTSWQWSAKTGNGATMGKDAHLLHQLFLSGNRHRNRSRSPPRSNDLVLTSTQGNTGVGKG